MAIGVLDMRDQLSPPADQVGLAAQEIPGGPHPGGIDIGLGEHTGSQELGDLERIDAIVLGLAPMDGFHVECMTENQGDVLPAAEVGEPLPAEDTLDTDDEVLAVGGDGLKRGPGNRSSESAGRATGRSLWTTLFP